MALTYISTPILSVSIPSYSRVTRNMPGFQKQNSAIQPTTMAVTTNAPVVQRSANYPPTRWSFDYIQSVTSNFVGENHKVMLQSLKERVRKMISKINENAEEKPMITLELVDDLQRLGISYHFKDEISNMLKTVYRCYYEDQEKWKKLHLNLKALGFRLLRQHGYPIPQEIFEDIKDEKGNIKTHIHEDIVGLLNLYEASFLAFEDDDMLDEVRKFTSKCLQEKLDQNIISDENMLMLISHAIETPLNWRVQRFEALWFMEVYEGRNDMKPLMLEFAILDFNILQGIHQEELKNLSRWWNSLAWDKKTDFVRDRLVESFVWGVSGNYEPAYGFLRIQVAKLVNLVNMMDDVYDTRGTLEELEQFTDVIARWDINAAEGLPYYMKICFVGLFNTTNEMAYEAMKNQGSFVVPYLKKTWIRVCDSLLKEARWFNSGYIPTLEEQLNNSWITTTLPVMVFFPYYVSAKEIKEEELENVVYLTSTILRLCNDLATATNEMERGNVSTSIQCYMNETAGASEEEARAYLKNLIIETWKKLNKERMITRSPSAQLIIDYTIDIIRNSHFTYLHGDNLGNPDEMYESHARGLLFNPKS